MKNMKKLSTAIIVVVASFVMAIPVLAVYQQNIYLPANQVWTTAGTAYRSGNRLNVYARCHSVYPDSGTDKFQIIQCRVLNSSGVSISDVVRLNETAGGYTAISIYDGYLAASPVTFQFRGNTNSSAYAVVSYQGY
jgi:hypothetical protein